MSNRLAHAQPRRERLLSDYMTIMDHGDDWYVLLEDGSAFAMIEVEGAAAYTAEIEHVNWLHNRLNLTYRNIAISCPEITIYDCRGHADPGVYPLAPSTNPLVRQIESAYRERLLDDSLYSNRLFVGVRMPRRHIGGEAVGGRLSRWFSTQRSDEQGHDDRVDALRALCNQLLSELKAYRPRQLGIVGRDGVDFSEIAAAIAFAFTGVPRKVPLVVGHDESGRHFGRLGNVVLSEDVIIGTEAVEFRGNGRSIFAAALSMREYPSRTRPGMFGALAVGPYCRTVMHSFTVLLSADGMSVVTRKQNSMVRAGDKAFSQVAGLTTLADSLQNNDLVMGLHNMVVIAFADGLKALAAVVDRVSEDMAGCGAVVIRERRALEAAIFSMLPGNAHLYVRPGTISSRNFAAMAPLHGFPTGPKRGRWGDPVCIFRSPAGTPVYFHWALTKNGNGNTLFTGESGSGKTLATGFLQAMSLRFAGVFAIDHKRGWEVLFRSMGAPYGILGAGRPVFSVLKALDASERNVEFLTELFRGCIMQDDYVPDDEESRRLPMGIRSVLSLPAPDRWLEDVCAFMGAKSGGAASRLRQWCWGQELGWVLDAPQDVLNIAGDVNAVDITQLMTNKRAHGPAVIYLMHRIALRLDGRPFLVPMDEGWLAAENSIFAPLIFAQARTIRSRGGVLVFITQSPADAAKEGIAEALVEQFPNQIHMANPRAKKAHYVDGLKRTEREYQIIRSLPPGEGMFLLSQGTKSQVCQLLMDGLDDEQSTLSTPEELLTLLDQVRAEVGEDHRTLIPEYHRRRKDAHQ